MRGRGTGGRDVSARQAKSDPLYKRRQWRRAPARPRKPSPSLYCCALRPGRPAAACARTKSRPYHRRGAGQVIKRFGELLRNKPRLAQATLPPSLSPLPSSISFFSVSVSLYLALRLPR